MNDGLVCFGLLKGDSAIRVLASDMEGELSVVLHRSKEGGLTGGMAERFKTVRERVLNYQKWTMTGYPVRCGEETESRTRNRRFLTGFDGPQCGHSTVYPYKTGTPCLHYPRGLRGTSIVRPRTTPGHRLIGQLAKSESVRYQRLGCNLSMALIERRSVSYTSGHELARERTCNQPTRVYEHRGEWCELWRSLWRTRTT